MLNMGRPIVVVGSLNMDLVANAVRIPTAGETVLGTRFASYPGGKGGNQAVAIARLGYPVNMIGKVGSDSFGDLLLSSLSEAGVNCDGVDREPGSSGVAIIVVSPQGENCIVVTPGANARLLPADIDRHIDLIRPAGAVLTQLEIPMQTVEHIADVCQREGVPLILDPAPAAELSAVLLRSVAWFTPNETEAAFYTTRNGLDSNNELDHIAATLMATGPVGVAMKLGEAGVYIANSQGLRRLVPGVPVDAVDSTAAGDAFNGAYATALLLGKDPVESASFAAAAAALSVTRHGAQSSLPTRGDVEELLKQSGERLASR